MAEQQIGVINEFFAHISVAGVELSDTMHVGDTIHVKGHTTDLEQTVDSMQIEHEEVQEATAGQAVGIKMKDRVRRGDHVFKVT
ncbi:MAG TPA: translation elongation factor-like protein [Dehalococcoidia bacterium]|nr:translation elongation factor-like protein [Dehalococcoidia bacterium]